MRGATVVARGGILAAGLICAAAGVIGAVFIGGGCHVVFPYPAASPDQGLAAPDRGLDARPRDLGDGPSPRDLNVPPVLDHGLPPCQVSNEATMEFLFTFDQAELGPVAPFSPILWSELINGAPEAATIYNPDGSAIVADVGPDPLYPGCLNKALELTASTTGHSPFLYFDHQSGPPGQDRGAVELSFWLDGATAGAIVGIVSKDAFDTFEPGHLTVLKLADNRLVLRLQDEAKIDRYLCSNGPVALQQWITMLINFGEGGTELYLDTAKQDSTDTFINSALNWTVTCAGEKIDSDVSITDNTRPWIIGGACNGCPQQGQPIPQHPFAGRVDDFRFYNARRTY